MSLLIQHQIVLGETRVQVRITPPREHRNPAFQHNDSDHYPRSSGTGMQQSTGSSWRTRGSRCLDVYGQSPVCDCRKSAIRARYERSCASVFRSRCRHVPADSVLWREHHAAPESSGDARWPGQRFVSGDLYRVLQARCLLSIVRRSQCFSGHHFVSVR